MPRLFQLPPGGLVAVGCFTLLVLGFALLAQVNLWFNVGPGSPPTPDDVLLKYHGDPERSLLDVVLDPGPASERRFLERHGRASVDRNRALALMELQRYAMLMFTSCGWFFDDLAGLEGVQVLRYAARAIELAEGLFGEDFTEPFLAGLEQAESNDPEAGNGRQVYREKVLPLSSR